MEKKNFFQRIKMPLPELEEYYRACRANSYENNEPIKGIKWRKRMHFLLILGLRISRLISGEKLCVINDFHTDTGKPLIYACTHIGWSDVEMAFAVIKAHAYAFWGDPGEMYRRSEGFLFYFNGVICCDSGDKDDRYIGKETCIRLLQQGGSLLIYPEGAWNIIENQVVMPLYSGTVEMAIRSGTEIVPIAIEQYNKSYYVNIGENINLEGYTIFQKREAANYLRDILCTLKWEIWEKYGRALRKDIPDGYIDTFLAEYEAQTDEAYTLEDVRNTRYHPKVTSPEEAFAFMEHLVPRWGNAFLFRERREGKYVSGVKGMDGR